MAEAVRFDPLEAGQLADPYPLYARLRREQPVFWAEQLGFWVVTRYDDVLAVLRDHATFSSADALRSSTALPAPAVLRALREGLPDMPVLIDTDPPRHTRIRALVNRAFTPRRIEALEPRVHAVANELLDGFAADGEADLIERFAWPLPLVLIGEMLGVDRADLDELHRLCHSWLLLFQASGSVEQQVAHAHDVVRLQRYFADALAERERAPRDDLVSALLAAQPEGEEQLTLGELVGVPLDLVVAGHVTVTRAIGNALVVLLEHPEELAAVRDDPARVPGAVEEILRLESPAQGLFRTTRRAVELGGVTLPAGARVMVHFGSANRDEGQFDDPAAFCPARADGGRHLAFGRGVHFCLGAPLARLELRVALPLLLRRLPGLRLAEGDAVAYEEIFFARGLSRLRLRWDA